MPKLKIIGRDGRDALVDGEIGQSVMQNIHVAGFDELLALCGGNCSCGTCHVYVEAGPPPPPGKGDEQDLLGGSDHRAENSRLSCQIEFSAALDGLTVRIAPED